MVGNVEKLMVRTGVLVVNEMHFVGGLVKQYLEIWDLDTLPHASLGLTVEDEQVIVAKDQRAFHLRNAALKT